MTTEAITLAFGQTVNVKAQAVRLKKFGESVRTTTRDAIRYGEHHGPAWEGEPLPDTPIDPTGRGAVMLRRFPLPTGTPGIVLGHTWREEGYVAGGGYDGEGVLTQVRRVPLWEVAIESQGKAHLLLVYGPDLEVTE